MKSILFYLALVMASIAVTSCHTPGCMNPDSFNYNPEADKDDGSCMEMDGCLGYSPNQSQSGSLGVTLNNAYYDQKMNEEVDIQRSFFGGVNANVYILYEPSYEQRNAYANSDGQILFGYHMFYYTIENFNELAVAGILAHEWSHRVQFTFGWNASMHNPTLELEADAFSGYYMALEKGYAWSQINGYFSSTYATGDYNFNSPQHHGTPDQRLAAAYLGVELALEAVNSQQGFTYEELHQRIVDSINVNILRKAGVTNEEESHSEVRDIADGLSRGKDIQRGPLTEEQKSKLRFHVE